MNCDKYMPILRNSTLAVHWGGWAVTRSNPASLNLESSSFCFFATYRTETYINGGILSKIGGFLVFFIRNARNMVANNVALFGRACYIVRT